MCMTMTIRLYFIVLGIKSDMNKMDSALSEQLLLRYKDLTRQFSVKSSFLSGYQLRQLREVMTSYNFDCCVKVYIFRK